MIRPFTLLVFLTLPLFGADKVITIQDDKVGIGVNEGVPTHKLQVRGGDVLIEDNLTVNQNVDLNGGSIDGAVIGGVTPADGTFEILSFSSLGTQLNANMFGLNEGFLILGDAQNEGSIVSLDSILNTNNGTLTVRGTDITYSHISGSLPLPSNVVQAGEDAVLGDVTVDSLAFQSTGTLSNVAISGEDSIFSGRSVAATDTVSFPNKSIQASDLQLAENQIFIGDNEGKAAPQNVGGDLSVNAAGVFAISDDSVTSAKIDNDTILSEDIFDHTITGDDLAPALTGIDIDGGNIDGVQIGNIETEQAAFTRVKTSGDLTVGGDYNANFPTSWGPLGAGKTHAQYVFSENKIGVGFNSDQSAPLAEINEFGKITARSTSLNNDADENYYKLNNAIINDRKDSIIDLRSLDGYATIDFSGTFDVGTDYHGRIGIDPGEEFLTIRTSHASIGVDMRHKQIINVADPTAGSHALNRDYVTDGSKTLTINSLTTNGTIKAKNTLSTINKVIRVRNAADTATMAEMRTDGMIWGKDLHITNSAGQSYVYTTYDTNNGILEVKGPNQAWVDIGRHENDYIGRFVAKQNESFPTIMSAHSTIGLDLDGKRLYYIADPAHDYDAANRRYVDNKQWGDSNINDNMNFHSLYIHTKIDMNNKKITELATPTASTDAATKGYVDGEITMTEGDAMLLNTSMTGTTWLLQGFPDRDLSSSDYIEVDVNVCIPGWQNVVLYAVKRRGSNLFSVYFHRSHTSEVASGTTQTNVGNINMGVELISGRVYVKFMHSSNGTPAIRGIAKVNYSK